MNHATETKKLNNNGFSLVELIIVVAIMAVLVGVLAPQYLQYVEKSRYQTDITMIDEIKGAIEVAIATNETIYAGAASQNYVSFSTGTAVIANSVMNAEVSKVVTLTECELTSTTCQAAKANIMIGTDANKNVYMKVPAAANESSSIITK